MGEYLGFTISNSEKEKKKEIYQINGVPVESGDQKIDMQGLSSIFAGGDIDAKALRESAILAMG